VLAIETRALTRHYGSLVAVDRLDLAVERGELYAFLGPNGAGKTTTIRMLTGLIQPTAGTAFIDGLEVTRNPLVAKARVGVVPQRSNLYGELSARDNLIFTGQLYGLPRRHWRPRADELLAQFGLAERADSPFASLSGGMKRRLTIAAALVHEPSILFLDEPTTGLDVQSARQVRALIADLHRRGVTIFLTTHLISEAEQLAGRVGIIVKGRLITVDTPAGLRARVQEGSILEVVIPEPAQALLAALRGSPAVEDLSQAGDALRLAVSSVDAALREVTAITQRFEAPIAAIHTVTPSLEDAFVRLTHLDLEAMQGGAGHGGGGGRR
jgi:ABC-2 type transport system ATP-binding protein